MLFSWVQRLSGNTLEKEFSNPWCIIHLAGMPRDTVRHTTWSRQKVHLGGWGLEPRSWYIIFLATHFLISDSNLDPFFFFVQSLCHHIDAYNCIQSHVAILCDSERRQLLRIAHLTSPIRKPRGSLGHHIWLHNLFPLFFSVPYCPLELGELQACSCPDVVSPPLLLSSLSHSGLMSVSAFIALSTVFRSIISPDNS